MILLEEFENIPLLQNLKPEYVKKIALAAELREYAQDVLLFREGEPFHWIFLILEGEVELIYEVAPEQGIPIQTLKAGELLGWSPLLGRESMTANARARNRCRLAALEVNRLVTLFDEDPRFGMEFLYRLALTLADRLDATRRQLRETK